MKLRFPLNKASVDVFVEDLDNDWRSSRKRRKKRLTGGPAAIKEAEALVDENGSGDNGAVEKADLLEPEAQAVLMVETENLTHEPFRQTEEIKVRTYFLPSQKRRNIYYFS